MKILIISDSHGNTANLKHVMGFAKKIGVKAIIHCGDWDNIESIDTVLSFGMPLYTVMGNADVRPEVSEELKRKSEKFGEGFLEFELGGRKIGVVHSFSNHPVLNIELLDIVFCGHIHSKDESVINSIKIVRPGAIINGNNFAIYNTDSDKIEFIDDSDG